MIVSSVAVVSVLASDLAIRRNPSGWKSATTTAISRQWGLTVDNLIYIREHVILGSRQAPGFASVISLSDRETDSSMGITLWDSREAMDMSEGRRPPRRGNDHAKR